MVSCGKDGLLVLHRMEQKQSPLSYACDMALDIAPDGLVGVAGKSPRSDADMPCLRQPYDPFRTPVRSQLLCGLPDTAMNTLQPSAFYKLAEKYLAGGRPLHVLCNHNANLAIHLGQSSVAQSWRLVGALLEQTGLQKVGVSMLTWGREFYSFRENPHYNDFTGLKDEAFALKPDLTKLILFLKISLQGDMQTCATLALVCGRRLSDVIDDFTVEWSPPVRFHVIHIVIRSINRHCEGCLTYENPDSDGPLLEMSWFCRKCHHAGHPHHILEWFMVSVVVFIQFETVRINAVCLETSAE
ncbi:unnamed protein product [Heligmosomoides polygyrus]|uniref:Uncharacterized protein n=1 Tax=Heligmosomoides polygyrus TaxID=6339 RepID=A0A3P7WM32_HELPZ|nr:unnamed protein product [Heligmosomoides polygyrus]